MTMYDSSEWNVGIATTKITPERSMWMAGFGAREDPSQGVEQELQAKALALEDADGRRVVIASVELLFVPGDIRDAVARACSDRYDLDHESLLIAATHTHCGPEFRDVKVHMYGLDSARYREAANYRAFVEEALVALVGQSLERLEPASLSYGRAWCGFAMNRRLPVEDGIAHVQNPDGPVDHDVPVLVIERDETVHGVVFGYACHTTSLVNYLKFSGDWAGFTQQYVEETYPEATALFLMGCAGDQNAYPRGTLELTRQHGRTMANAVQAAIDATRQPVRGPLRVVYEEQPVEFEDPPDTETLERRLDSDDPFERRKARLLLDERDRTGAIQTVYPYRVQGVGFGSDLTLLALAGEVLVEYGLQLKRESSGELWVTGYANDDFTYVPTTQTIYEGGYEGGDVIRYTAYPGPLKTDVEERVLSASRAVIDRARNSR